MNEFRMTLGTDWTGQDPAGWWISEKLDGCRAYWDGARFWTRGGNVIQAPAWFIDGLPDCHLDGELWAGRGGFTVARVATQTGRWNAAVRFAVFDAPMATGTWSARMDAARASLRTPLAACVEFRACIDRVDMGREFCRVTQAGGEGLILRNPAAVGYEVGRTANLLKVKPL